MDIRWLGEIEMSDKCKGNEQNPSCRTEPEMTRRTWTRSPSFNLESRNIIELI